MPQHSCSHTYRFARRSGESWSSRWAQYTLNEVNKQTTTKEKEKKNIKEETNWTVICFWYVVLYLWSRWSNFTWKTNGPWCALNKKQAWTHRIKETHQRKAANSYGHHLMKAYKLLTGSPGRPSPCVGRRDNVLLTYCITSGSHPSKYQLMFVEAN